MVETHRSRAAAAVAAAAEATMAEETGDAVAGTRDAAVEEGDLTGTGVICAFRKVVNTEVEFINIGYRLSEVNLQLASKIADRWNLRNLRPSLYLG